MLSSFRVFEKSSENYNYTVWKVEKKNSEFALIQNAYDSLAVG